MRPLGLVLITFLFPACYRSSPAFEIPPANSYTLERAVLTGSGTSETIQIASVTDAFFPATKSRALLGRLFAPEEHKPASQPVAVLRRELWQRRFGSDPGIIGRTIELNGRPYTVVGVMPQGFDVPQGAEMWIPKVTP
jgi:putative ABC transport system permease protein